MKLDEGDLRLLAMLGTGTRTIETLSADLDRLRRDVGERHLLVLPRPFDLMPGDIAAELLDAGGNPELPALVYERLTHDDEARTATTVGDLVAEAGGDSSEDTRFSDLTVFVVRCE